jgi:starvation-inducible DNA-binding protein
MEIQRNGDPIPKLHILIQPNIGLDSDTRLLIIEILNTVLADEEVLTMKTRSAHWHLCGPGLFDLKTLFEQQCEQLIAISEEIVERTRMLGGSAISSFEEFLSYTHLQELPGEAPGLMNLLADHETSIRFLRDYAQRCFEDYEDQVTFTLFVRFIHLHEKMAWILRSYIEPEMSSIESQGNKIRSVQR